MKRLFVVLAFASLASFAQDKQAPGKMDPARKKPLENALRGITVLPANRLLAKADCVYMKTVPVNKDIDEAIVKELPAVKTLDNMPVLQALPTCPASNK